MLHSTRVGCCKAATDYHGPLHVSPFLRCSFRPNVFGFFSICEHGDVATYQMHRLISAKKNFVARQFAS